MCFFEFVFYRRVAERVCSIMKKIMSVILAAGESPEMKSKYPKAVFDVCGKPMISYVADSVSGIANEKNVIVVGKNAQMIKDVMGEECVYCRQENLSGTAEAINSAKSEFENFDGLVIVLPCDIPLITKEEIKSAVDFHLEFNNAATVVTAFVQNPEGYGRIIRNNAGDVAGIVEHMHANQYELEISEINTSIYVFDAAALRYALENRDSLSGEFDKNNIIHFVEVLIKSGRRVGAYEADCYTDILGVNNRIQLFEAQAIMRNRINRFHMLNGVTITAPAVTYIESNVTIGSDTVIAPNVTLKGNTTIGCDVTIGANSIIENSKIEDGADILSSVIKDSKVGECAHIGPFAYLRPNSKIGKNVKIGDFVEIKNAVLDEGTKVSHLTYVGDSDVGKGVNFGCGCVTVNYDGSKKYRCSIGDNAFIGCNTNLVAPVTVNDGAYIAAGSTITDEVPENTLAIARSRQVIKTNWKDRRNKNK